MALLLVLLLLYSGSCFSILTSLVYRRTAVVSIKTATNTLNEYLLLLVM